MKVLIKKGIKVNKKRGKKIGSVFITIAISTVLVVSIGLYGVYLLNTVDSVKMIDILTKIDIFSIFSREIDSLAYDTNGYDKTLTVDPVDINPSSDFTLIAVDGGWSIQFYNNSTDKEVVIPKTNSTDGQPIVSIAIQAFHNMRLNSVIIPNSITSIGDFAFYSNQLTSVMIPSSVTSIGSAAFNVNNLRGKQAFIYSRNPDGSENPSILVSYGGSVWTGRDATIPSSVTIIGKHAFNNIRLKTVEIPDGVITIEEYAFYKNELSSITIPSSVATISESAFRINHLKYLSVSSNITSIGSYAFDTNMLETVKFEGQVPPTLGVDIFTNNITMKLGSTKVPNAFLKDYQSYEVSKEAFGFSISECISGY